MTSTTQPTTKENKNTTSSGRRRRGGGGLFSFGGCFGLSSPKKQHGKKLYQDPAVLPSAHAHGDDAVESVKYTSKKPDQFHKSDLPTSESIKEIQIVAATAVSAKAPPPLLHQLNNKIDQEMIAEEKNKNKQEQSIAAKVVQETSGSPMIKLRHSVSEPPPQPRLKKGKTAAEAGKVDPMVGVSMIALTLAVMLIWGKVCAILCSAAWVFFVHCFKHKNQSFQHKNDIHVSSDNKILDLDSHEYKKRVVLQGFLQRI